MAVGNVFNGLEDNSSEEISLEDAVEQLGGDTSEETTEEEEETDNQEDETTEEDVESEEEVVEEETEKEESLQDLIDKAYQGKSSEFVKGLRESWKTSSEVAKKLDRLEQLLARQADKPESETDPEPDVAVFDEELQELQEEYVANTSQQESLLTSISKLAAQENKIRGQLEVLDSDDPRRTSLEDKLYGIQRDISSKSDSYKSTQRDQKKLERQGKAVQRKRAEEIDRQKKQFNESRRASKASMQAAHETVDSTIDSLLEKHEIPEEHHRKLGVTIKSEVINFLSALPEDQGPADLERVTNEVGGALLAVVSKMTKTKLVKGSKDKLQASRSGSTKQPKRPGDNKNRSMYNRTKTDADWRKEAAQARADARRLLGG